MKHPHKAIVLAAGYGSRLLPLTLVKPKPLFPLWGTPALGHTLDLLRRWGVRDVLVNAHYHAGQILDYLRTHPVDGLRCQVSFEPEILGTGGALTKARWFLDEEPFWMVNADVMADLPCLPLLKAHHDHNPIATLWLHPDRGPRTVEHCKGRVTVFKSSLAGTEGTATFCGFQLLSTRIFRHLPPSGFASIVDAYENAMIAGECVAAAIVPGSYWADIGTPQSYLAAHQEMSRLPRWKRFRSAGGVFLAKGPGTTIHPRATVTNSVLWDNVTVTAGARVTNAIVSDGVRIQSPAEYMAIRADHVSDPIMSRILREMKWDPARTTLMPLPPRGSARTFTRLVTRSPAASAMVVRYTLERPENGLYASHARFLAKHGVRVPAVLLDWPDQQVCVMEDVGTDNLEHLVPSLKRASCIAFYKQTLDTVARLHTTATQAARRKPLKLSIPFTRHLYEWEQNLFCDQFLNRHLEIRPSEIDDIRRELSKLIPAQVRAPRVIIHRDLQSSNVMIRDGSVYLIDFQGMRFGTAAYDLASLLCDPYVNLAGDVRLELLDYYLKIVPDSRPVRDLFWVAAVERLVQALGAFGRLGAIPSTAYFLKHIPPGIRQLQNALQHVRGLSALKRCLEEKVYFANDT